MFDGEIMVNDIWLSLNLFKVIIFYFCFLVLMFKIFEVYDVWCDGDYGFVLMEDCFEWDVLVDVLWDEGDFLLGLEMVFWIN